MTRERFTVVDMGLRLGAPRRFVVWDNIVSKFWKINGRQAWTSIAELTADFDARWPKSEKFHTVHREQRDRIFEQAFVLGFATDDDQDAPTVQAAPEKCPRCWFTPCRKMFQCSEQGGYRFVDADPVGYISDARVAEIGRCAEVNARDHVLTTSITSRDLQLLVAELQRRRGHQQ